jgi:hypothetical protein
LLILYLWGVSFHAVVVFGLGKDFLFKSTLGHFASFVFCLLPTANVLKVGLLWAISVTKTWSDWPMGPQFSAKQLNLTTLAHCILHIVELQHTGQNGL